MKPILFQDFPEKANTFSRLNSKDRKRVWKEKEGGEGDKWNRNVEGRKRESERDIGRKGRRERERELEGREERY